MLVHNDENRDMLKYYRERRCTIRDLLRLARNNLNDYDKKYMKIITKSLQLYRMITALRSVFYYYGNKYYV